MSRTRFSQSCLIVAMQLGMATASAPAEEVEESLEPSAWEQVLELYESAKAAGENVPADVYAWVKQDFTSIGDWEYLITELSAETEATVLQHHLNVLGKDRWECVWIQPIGDQTRYIMKRPARSYLKHLPLSQLLKVMPGGGSGGSE